MLIRDGRVYIFKTHISFSVSITAYVIHRVKSFKLSLIFYCVTGSHETDFIFLEIVIREQREILRKTKIES